jgi:hypothetical protein
VHTQGCDPWFCAPRGGCLPFTSLARSSPQHSKGLHHHSGEPVSIAQPIWQALHMTAGRLHCKPGGSHIHWPHRSCRHPGCTCNQHGAISPGPLCNAGCHSTLERCADRPYSDRNPTSIAVKQGLLCPKGIRVERHTVYAQPVQVVGQARCTGPSTQGLCALQ